MRASKNLPMTWALLPLFAAVALPAQANVFISTQPTSNMSCSGGVCAPTAQPANLNTTDLAHMLASSDVTVMSGNDTSRRDIVVKSALGWASSHRLTLDANYAVTIDAPIVVHGPGSLTVTRHRFPGDLTFGPGGHVAFWDLSSSFVLNGVAFTLVGDIGGLTSAIAANSAGNFALAGDVKPTAPYTASPIPTTFTGVLEGLGNRILYLRISDTAANQHDGLFATIGVYGIVRDLGLVNAKVQGTSGSRIGTFAGENDGAILQSYATGMVLHTGSGGYLGGMVGWSMGSISNSYSEASVRGQQNVSAGGIAGAVSCCGSGGGNRMLRASGDVTAGNGSSAGGLVGTNTGVIGSAQASGNVTAGSASFAGGLIGQGSGSIVGVFATGAVKVGNLGKAGGLQGRFDGGSETDSYATGSVTGAQGRCSEACSANAATAPLTRCIMAMESAPSAAGRNRPSAASWAMTTDWRKTGSTSTGTRTRPVWAI